MSKRRDKKSKRSRDRKRRHESPARSQVKKEENVDPFAGKEVKGDRKETSDGYLKITIKCDGADDLVILRKNRS